MRKFLLSLLVLIPSLAVAFTPTPTPVAPSGAKATIDLPAELHQRNTGGSDGLGLCVFSAFEDMCEWMGHTEMRGFHKWMEQWPGGGWPQKLDQMVKLFCDEKGIPVPEYIQHTGGDEELLSLAIKTRRGACVTYSGMDDFYSGDIAHMVYLSEFGRTDDTSILDNNRPGEWVWMTRSQFTFRWKLNTVGQGWAVVLLGPPPPPSEDGVDPAPKPKPKPKPKPRRKFLPWKRVDFADGSVLWKLLNEDGSLEGVWDDRGWHKAVGPDGWSVDPTGEPPVEPPVERVAENVNWLGDYNDALAKSKTSGKPILLVISSKTCKWCRVLESNALKDPAVVAKINALFIPVKVEDPGAEFMRVFGAKAFPTSVVIGDKGAQIVNTAEGALDATGYLEFLQESIPVRNSYRWGDRALSKDEAHKLIDDSDKWFVTLVVESEAQRQALLEHLASVDFKSDLAKVHLNVYASDFWAAKRLKHSLTVQRPAGKDNSAVWTADSLTDKDILTALVKAGAVKPVDPVKPVPEPVKPTPEPVKPEPNASPSVPSQPSSDPITIPLWAFWGGVAGAGFALNHLLRKG